MILDLNKIMEMNGECVKIVKNMQLNEVLNLGVDCNGNYVKILCNHEKNFSVFYKDKFGYDCNYSAFTGTILESAYDVVMNYVKGKQELAILEVIEKDLALMNEFIRVNNKENDIMKDTLKILIDRHNRYSDKEIKLYFNGIGQHNTYVIKEV